MAHQEGYKDRREKGASNRLEGPATRSGKRQKERKSKETNEKTTRDKRHMGQQHDRQKTRHSTHLLTKCRRNSPNGTGAAEARQNEDALTHETNQHFRNDRNERKLEQDFARPTPKEQHKRVVGMCPLDNDMK